MLIETVRLGVQTSPNNVVEKSIWMAGQWAKKSARSWTICLQDTTYHGAPVDHPTGYALITVRYFSTQREGLVR